MDVVIPDENGHRPDIPMRAGYRVEQDHAIEDIPPLRQPSGEFEDEDCRLTIGSEDRAPLEDAGCVELLDQ